MHGSAPLVVFIVVIIGHIQHQGNGTHLLFLICTGSLISQATYVLIGVGSTILSVTIIEFISACSEPLLHEASSLWHILCHNRCV